MIIYGDGYYWLSVDYVTGNPTGEACWAYYGLSDKPTEGNWILVKEAYIPIETNKNND